VTGVTHLGRTISLGYPTHRWMLGLVAAVALIGMYPPGARSPVLALVEGSLTVFLSWGIVRELDPDHPLAAVLGSAAAGMATIATSASAITALAGLMVASHVLTRSTGLRPLLTDIVAVGAFAGIFARTPAAWAVGLGVATAGGHQPRAKAPQPGQTSCERQQEQRPQHQAMNHRPRLA
jgi:hypothetical protein